MSLDVSPEIEARIIVKAQEARLSIDDYLEQVVVKTSSLKSPSASLRKVPRHGLRRKLRPKSTAVWLSSSGANM
jgi:hypothetical protein